MDRSVKSTLDPRRRNVSPVVWRILATIVVVLLVTFFVVSFVEGRPITGSRLSWRLSEAFEAYGRGAFAADSANWLTFIGAVLALYIASWAGRAKVPARALTIASIATAVAGGFASIVLLAVYWSSGIPFRNFQAEKLADIQAFMYGSSFLVPGITVVVVGAIGGVVLRSQVKAQKAQG